MSKLAFYINDCRLFVAAATLVAIVECVARQGLADEREDLWQAGQLNRANLLQYLRPLLKQAGGGGRLYYRVQCWPKEDDFSYPQLELQAPPLEKTGLDAAREIFKRSNQVTVTEGQHGMIGIRIGKVSDELLKTEIDVLTLSPSERYNPQEAMIAIERTREVQAKIHELGIVNPPTILHEHPLEPGPGLPHLSTAMKKITFDEALNEVARTFKCLVVWGECTRADGTHLFSIEFVDIAGIDAFLKKK